MDFPSCVSEPRAPQQRPSPAQNFQELLSVTLLGESQVLPGLRLCGIRPGCLFSLSTRLPLGHGFASLGALLPFSKCNKQFSAPAFELEVSPYQDGVFPDTPMPSFHLQFHLESVHPVRDTSLIFLSKIVLSFPHPLLSS